VCFEKPKEVTDRIWYMPLPLIFLRLKQMLWLHSPRVSSGDENKLTLYIVDGPYGTVPSFTSFTTVIFIAGGSGASFTAGVAIDLLRKLGESTKTTIIFTWVVKDQGIIFLLQSSTIY
jgi:hypothetical protein